MRPDWNKLSQAERDAAYDNNRAVVNSAALIEQRNAASAAFRAARANHLDLPYGSKERTKFDLFPSEVPESPCLVFIHGGYWQRNRREDFAAFAAGMMAHGWSVAIPGYSLAPEVTLTEIAAEIDQALTWLAAHGQKHGLARGRIIVSGWSAGAHLAAMALDHPAVAAGVAISGVFDLAPIRETYLNEKLRLSDQEVAGLSPLKLPPVNKPLLLSYGTHEQWPLVEDSRDLHARRSAAHAPGALVPIANADHFTILQQLQSANSTLVSHIQRANQ
jgi:arylformamidase